MRALRKTGVRAPFLPGPILEAGAAPPSEMLRPVVVIGAIVPALLLGGVARPIGIPTRDANVDPRRPTVVIQGQMPVPGAAVRAPTPARLPNTDPLRPVQVAVGQQPVPDARTQWVSRPSLPEDTTRPARPAIVVGVPVPIPGAVTWLGTPAHETPGAQPDRALQERAIILAGQQPIPGALAQFTSRPAIVEDTAWPARPAAVRVGQQPTPGAVVVQTYAPRDQVAAQPDRVAQEQAAVFVGGQPIPGVVIWKGEAPRVVNIDPRRPVVVVVNQPPIPGARLAWVGVVHDGDRLRTTGPQTLSGQQPRPEAQTLRVGRTTQTPTDRIRASGPLTCGPPVPVPGMVVLRVGAALELPPTTIQGLIHMNGTALRPTVSATGRTPGITAGTPRRPLATVEED